MGTKGVGVPDVLHVLSDPNLAFVLLVLGGLGLTLELVHPNFVTGTIGAISLVLAFIGLTNLPLDAAGLLFIGVGLVLFVLESSVPTHGFLTVGGLLCIAVGALTLYAAPPTGSTQPPVTVAGPVIIAVLGFSAAFMAVALVAARRASRLSAPRGSVGTPLPPGSRGEVRRPLDPLGSVYVGGEEWSARTRDARSLDRGTPVQVVAQDGLTVVVEALESAAAS
jgi:membrane-bound serine protease (ClpP class)